MLRPLGFTLASVLTILFLNLAGPSAAPVPEQLAQDKPTLRRPVALAWVKGGKHLAVANRDSGTVAVLDGEQLRLVAEVSAGRRLSALASVPDSRDLLAADEATGELIRLSWDGAKLTVGPRLPVGSSPVDVRVTGDGKEGVVASLWGRQIRLVDLAGSRVRKTLDLPFAPRQLLLVEGDRYLVAADAFGGRLAVVDVPRGELVATHTILAHNIRGLSLSADGKRLFLTQQILHDHARTTHDDVHWGNLQTNNVRELRLAAVLTPGADLLEGSQLYYLGDPSRAFGDPTGIAVTAARQIVLTGAGVDQVALGSEPYSGLDRLTVGRRPTAVVASPDGRRAFVANTFGDSLSVIDLKARKVEATVPLGAQRPLTPAEQGEVLFHSARVSLDGWFSCHSCHPDGHSNGSRNDNLGDGSFGAPKRVLSLLGVRDSGPWSWNGAVEDLESQVKKSVETTMRGRDLRANQVEALTAYLRTLTPPPPLDVARQRTDEAQLRRGQAVFTKQDCGRCHAAPVYTSAKTYNVGLTDELGNKQFNPPSLRGVSQGGPYFHDTRAATLEEVFTKQRHQLHGELSKQELDDLLAFLRSL